MFGNLSILTIPYSPAIRYTGGPDGHHDIGLLLPFCLPCLAFHLQSITVPSQTLFFNWKNWASSWFCCLYQDHMLMKLLLLFSTQLLESFPKQRAKYWESHQLCPSRKKEIGLDFCIGFILFCILFYFILFHFISFFGNTHGIWKFLGQGLNLSRSCHLCHSWGNRESSNPLHRAGDGTHASTVSWAAEVGFLTHCATMGTPIYILNI